MSSNSEAGREADTIVILSSELISKITEEYFNKTMFKQKVTIVDLKPTESGYMFSVAFSPKGEKGVVQEWMSINSPVVPQGKVVGRAVNGQFVKVNVADKGVVDGNT